MGKISGMKLFSKLFSEPKRKNKKKVLSKCCQCLVKKQKVM